MLDSIVRTFVPVVVGVLLGYAAKAGFDLPEGAVTEVVTAVAIGVYYMLARAVEQVWPRFGGVLLSAGLSRRHPVYLREGHKPVA